MPQVPGGIFDVFRGKRSPTTSRQRSAPRGHFTSPSSSYHSVPDTLKNHLPQHSIFLFSVLYFRKNLLNHEDPKNYTMMNASDPAPSTPFQPVSNHYYKIMRQYQVLLDRVTPFVLYRWLGTAGLLSLFMLRIVLAQGVSFHSRFSSRLHSH